ncbi:unnamed protein product [Darwinula stevensoni]|uniref:G-protein coupled receptors family 1 profile domain-containing protein n=1 Tax=Darwinula stevensoni TaxID=69355 RepID=A0A7R9FQY3_9CRUS|nr:unnamed protein product [Darwinula stevensoni]CAG0900008.1 unnamed protein product [Darwinula stevensoni]
MAAEEESNESLHLDDEATSVDLDGVTLHFPGMFQTFDFGMAVILALFIVLTVVGNVLVLVVIKVTPSMRSPMHLLTGNLAVSYTVTGLLVLPFSALLQFGGEWKFGHTLCRVWAFLDKLCCGATVLSLCVIAVDRYVGVSRPLAHDRIMSRFRTQSAIALTWVISLAMSLGLLVDSERKPVEMNCCSVRVDATYFIFRAIVNILIPSVVLLVLYWKVYRKAVSVLRSRRDESDCDSLRIRRCETSTTSMKPSPSVDRVREQSFDSGFGHTDHSFTVDEAHRSFRRVASKARACDHRHLRSTVSFDDTHSVSTGDAMQRPRRVSFLPWKMSFDEVLTRPWISILNVSFRRSKDHQERKARMQAKAAKTTAVMVVVFIVCWFPRFVVQSLALLCPRCGIPDPLLAACFWLCYSNSLLNPFVYAVASREFWRELRRLLCRR